MDYVPENKMRSLTPKPPTDDCPLTFKSFSRSINTEQEKKNPRPQICDSSLRTVMTMEFFLGAAALINLHHFNVNFEEGWGQRDERAAFGSRLGRGALMYRVCVCVRPGSEGRPFACKLRQTLHVQIIHPGWGKLCYCNGL